MGTQELSANRRLGTVANHVAPRRAGDDGDGRGDDAGRNDARARPTPSGGAGTLRCVDGRTGKSYDLAISADGCVDAAAFKQIKAGGDGRGLVLYDPGYVNTAPCRSKISYIDGDRGILRYRGYPIETLAESSTYLESAFALV